ncbi:MAG: hypothetical protein HN919_12015 [Verrucomicrobia bacterium]|jgi:two-component system, NtrC family, sensor kinase|nr:hypothetical protein [Verrucomicrobiota bacterium]
MVENALTTQHDNVADLRAALVDAHQEVLSLQARLAEAEWIGEALRERTRELGERTKELECLYRISDCLRNGGDVAHVLQRIVNAIPQGYQYPETTSAELRVLGRRYRSTGFRQASTSHTCKIHMRGLERGEIRVFASQGSAITDRAAMLPEENALLQAVATWVGEIVDRLSE